MIWEVDGKSKKQVDALVKAAKDSDEIILASDPDREGEAISWHVREVLEAKKALKGKPVHRVVFNEITKKAVTHAMANPRDIDQSLVDAYMARRALDYLVGFTLSPVLWRKLPGSRSAGRVQSVALRLICERESEIEAFIPQEYWSVEAQVEGVPKTQAFTAKLVELEGKKLDRLSIENEVQAKAAEAAVRSGSLTIQSITPKQVKRNPAPPFITSTMQQEASRKLGFTATRTMQTAQRLYEGIKIGQETIGLITYMRTDGVNLSEEALTGMRGFIQSEFGDRYLPSQARRYKSKAKNAQEAHEAIRPTDIRRTPAKMRNYLNEDQAKLYELIWKRALASQMEQAILDQVSIEIPNSSRSAVLRATGSVLKFDGFLKLYQEGRDDDSDDENDRRLPELKEGQTIKLLDVVPEQHFTKPPPRYTEASLVKTMEELGIGRPSTYASIIRVLQDRNYVEMDARRFVPEDRGRLVTTFLTHFFERYVQYDFTANLETQLDDVSGSRLDWHSLMNEFWTAFKQTVDGTSDLTITQVIDTLNDDLAAYFFPEREDGKDARLCPTCNEGQLGLRLGRYGSFIGCSNYPDCKYTRQLKTGEQDEAAADFSGEPVELGKDPDTGKQITLQKGPYGFYVQLGEEETITPPPKKLKSGKVKESKPKKVKPKRASLPAGKTPDTMTLDDALKLLSLPRDLGEDPISGTIISAGLGRFGPYVKLGSVFVSLKKDDDVNTIDLTRAVELIEASGKRAIELGEYKKAKVEIQKGRFGHFIVYKRLKVNLAKGTDPSEVTLEKAVALIEAKLEKENAAKTTKKAPAKKAATKKKTTAKA